MHHVIIVAAWSSNNCTKYGIPTVSTSSLLTVIYSSLWLELLTPPIRGFIYLCSFRFAHASSAPFGLCRISIWQSWHLCQQGSSAFRPLCLCLLVASAHPSRLLRLRALRLSPPTGGFTSLCSLQSLYERSYIYSLCWYPTCRSYQVSHCPCV